MTPAPRCTIKDIAAKAGVAVSTVSYALRNHPSIPPETCQRIQAVGEKLGYRPDPFLMAVAIMMLELFVAFLQAFIFTLLASVSARATM